MIDKRIKDEAREKMKRIFMVGYSVNKGGVETYIDQLTEALPQYEIILNAPVMRIDGKEWHRPKNRHRYIHYRMFWSAFFRETRFDAVYYNTCDIVSIDMLRFARRAGVPVRIIHSHSSDNQQYVHKKMDTLHLMAERINRKTLNRYATHLLACSENAGRWMFGNRPFTVINNGINTERYRYCDEAGKAIREQYGFDNCLLVGIIGRLSAPKNPAYSLQILEALFRIEPASRAVFIGDGPLRQETEEAAERTGIRERIVFTGAVDNVPEWMFAVNALLMPSLFEGFPFVLIEAQAAGLPCVVSSVITHEVDLTGLIQFMDLSDAPEKWAEKLLSCGKQKRTDCTGRIISAGYSIQHTAQQVTEIIESGGSIRN